MSEKTIKNESTNIPKSFNGSNLERLNESQSIDQTLKNIRAAKELLNGDNKSYSNISYPTIDQILKNIRAAKELLNGGN